MTFQAMLQHNEGPKTKTLLRHSLTLSRQRSSRRQEEFVTTLVNSVATKNKANGKKNKNKTKNFTTWKGLAQQMRREINEDMLKQCRDIMKCRRKKFYHNTI